MKQFVDFVRLLNAVFTLLLLSACTASSLQLPSAAPTPLNITRQPVPTLAPMIKQITPAVVNIATEGRVTIQADNPMLQDPFFQRFFDLHEGEILERKTSSLGSGVVIDAKRGYIVTNLHVIDRADDITVTLNDGRYFGATVIGTDVEADIALLQVSADNLSELPLADSDVMQVGDFVVAIGNPFGLGQTVTSGIVSAVGRSGLGIQGYEDFIQTDASINPGNSGGALVSLDGKLIGINTAILAPAGGNIGISFAIPANRVKQSLEQLLRYGQVRRGQLGVSVRDLTPQLARELGLNRNQGAMIIAIVPGSAAAGAGLQKGDIIVSVNGKLIRDAKALRNAIGLFTIGDRVDVDVMREGRKLNLSAKIGQREKQS